MNRMLHTPEGVRDIYAKECRRMSSVENAMKSVIELYGYEPVRTPGFEYFDVFSREVGSTSSKELYKFFDKDNNTLVLRPDFTPSVARAASKTEALEIGNPIRLYYNGNIYINHTSHQGRMMESRQFGAEYMGESSADADAELIAAVVECLKSTGLSDFLVSVTHADIFLGLVEAAGLSDDESDEVRELILNKNFFGLEEVLREKKLPEDLMSLFKILDRMGDIPDESDFPAIRQYPRIKDALDHLRELDSLLELYGVTDHVSFEPGLLSSYRYYTGIVFNGYTYGSGQPLVKGGRYDRLLSYFGKDAPAIGFAISVDALLAALEQQGLSPKDEPAIKELEYNEDNRNEVLENAKKLRSYGTPVVLRRARYE